MAMFLTIEDYIVTASLLLVPLVIGVYYAWKDSKKVNRVEYLMGGREMNVIPVAFSMFVTFQSAISLVGVPGEVYLYGIPFVIFYVGVGLSYTLGCYLMIPLFYPLYMTSIFNYLELRYNSRAVRKLGTIFGMLKEFFYLVVAMLAPGLALQAGAGIPFFMSVGIVGGIGTVYTAIGGIKSVIWTDAFQTVVVFIGIMLVIVRGCMVVGGLDEVWNIAEVGGRTYLGEISPDPRVRHSLWGLTIASCIHWFTQIFSQSSLQRISTMPTMKKAQQMFHLNNPLNVIWGISLGLVGIVVYAYIYSIDCDPIAGGIITNANQLIIFFVIHIFQDLPGLAGLYMATIFSGALSTLSSGINALAANTVEDFLEGHLHGMHERNVTILIKFIVFLYGAVIIGVTYLARSLQGPVTQMAVSVMGVCGSSVLGMFVAGCTIPWANKYGAFSGCLVSFTFTACMAVGGRMYGRPADVYPPASIEQCPGIFNETWVYPTSSHAGHDLNTLSNSTTTQLPISISPTATVTASSISDAATFIFSISYVWYTMIGLIIGITINLVVSKITQRWVKTKVDSIFILPMLRSFWQGHTRTKAVDAKSEEAAWI